MTLFFLKGESVMSDETITAEDKETPAEGEGNNAPESRRLWGTTGFNCKKYRTIHTRKVKFVTNEISLLFSRERMYVWIK